jgi:uncharacterized surface protein with fasciclin (FAS1) repeats
MLAGLGAAGAEGEAEAAEAEATPEPEEEAAPALTDVVDSAAANEELSTFVAALSAAGLAEELTQEGPYTLFVPTNDAFAALPEGTLDALLADPAGDLTQILLNHVVPGTIAPEDITDGLEATTAQGSPLTFSVTDDGAKVNDANIVGDPVESTNGVIYTIDSVLMPAAGEEAAEAEATPTAEPEEEEAEATPTAEPEEEEAEATPTAQPEEEEMAAEGPGVTVEDQESDGLQVTVASVDTPVNAWLVIEADADGKPGQVLGTTAVPAGTTENVVVILDEPITGENHLWAMLHEDAGEAGTWEFPEGPDVPMMAGDEMVMAPFTAVAPGGEAEAAMEAEATEAPAEEAAPADATPEPAEEGAAAEATAQPEEEAAMAPAQMPATGAAGMGGLTSIAVVTMVLAGLAVGTFAVRRRKS